MTDLLRVHAWQRIGWRKRAFLDAVLDAYLAWREEAAAVVHANRRWDESPRGDRSIAFAAYGAALDREEHAAAVYADMVRHAERALAHRSARVGFRRSGTRLATARARTAGTA